ncbi:MAG: hypothetical protein HQK54_05130 [Oligoflexales bacterium]|nr:hypothetical protein [Oligoflexales bacterium]
MDFGPIRGKEDSLSKSFSQYVIGTTILDANIPVRKYSDTYHARWGIEEMYKTTKTMLNAEYLRSKNENGVLQEIYANFTLQSMTRIIANSVDNQINHCKILADPADKGYKLNLRVNFSNIIQTVQRKISGLFAFSQKTIKKTIETIFKTTSRVYQASRPGRSFPRISMRPTKRLRAA